MTDWRLPDELQALPADIDIRRKQDVLDEPVYLTLDEKILLLRLVTEHWCDIEKNKSSILNLHRPILGSLVEKLK